MAQNTDHQNTGHQNAGKSGNTQGQPDANSRQDMQDGAQQKQSQGRDQDMGNSAQRNTAGTSNNNQNK